MRGAKPLDLVAGKGQLLGLFPNPLIDEQCITLPADSLVVMYTDGVTEAMDPTGELFGEERLRSRAVCRSQSDRSSGL